MENSLFRLRAVKSGRFFKFGIGDTPRFTGAGSASGKDKPKSFLTWKAAEDCLLAYNLYSFKNPSRYPRLEIVEYALSETSVAPDTTIDLAPLARFFTKIEAAEPGMFALTWWLRRVLMNMARKGHIPRYVMICVGLISDKSLGKWKRTIRAVRSRHHRDDQFTLMMIESEEDLVAAKLIAGERFLQAWDVVKAKLVSS
jgi:hypothetical protein